MTQERLLSTLALIILAVMFLACGGGVPSFTSNEKPLAESEAPKSEAPSDATTPAKTETGVTPSQAMQPPFIPGLAAVDVYGNFTKQGFKLERIFDDVDQPMWSCVNENDYRRMLVDMVGESTSRITSIRALYMNKSMGDTDEACKDFLGYAATIPYDGSEPAKAKAWVMDNVGENTTTTIGNVTFELIAKVPRIRVLLIEPKGKHSDDDETTQAEREAEALKPVEEEKRYQFKLAEKGQIAIRGLVHRVDLERNRITIERGRSQNIYSLAPDCEILLDGKKITIEELHPGLEVQIVRAEYKTDALRVEARSGQ